MHNACVCHCLKIMNHFPFSVFLEIEKKRVDVWYSMFDQFYLFFLPTLLQQSLFSFTSIVHCWPFFSLVSYINCSGISRCFMTHWWLEQIHSPYWHTWATSQQPYTVAARCILSLSRNVIFKVTMTTHFALF